MPNFIAKKCKNLTLPFEKDGVKFLNLLKGRKVDFILTRANEELFFVTVKKKDDAYLFKGEKLTRPAKVGLLQKALEILRDEFCSEILNNSINFNKNSLTKNSSIIMSELEAIKALNGREKIAIEIGFGSGRHLLYRAKNELDKLFVGIEIYKPSIEQVAKLAIKQNIENLVLVNSDARTFIDLVGSNLVDTIYVHFPVPWDDSPHRRVISGEFMSEIQRILKVGGTFELRSDSRAYVDYSLIKFLDMDGVSIKVHKNRDLEISSKYEDRWKKQLKDIYDVWLKNLVKSGEKSWKDRLKFDILDINLVKQNFRHKVTKFSDFFLNFEEIYEFDSGELLIKLSFGAFDTPGNYFIKISKDKTEYFIAKPLPTDMNLKAHEKVKEQLAKWQIL
ncbi:tRNA (guanosine(46)-N7)-methyltransferase TrmB [Campylobacter corcagiensis]|uniref:tRNA (guanine-N(7)-)-methyltransferase n=1 Tax=Campylobacter corcagiensis TaxID=1448857 RepID=A0A7M1LGC4_9BACT|nr:tRNA (guanosine(46)-N7)-methyltransferase TrmB [Campylobacter corcagiensis]QKF64431.1 tRNA m7G46 methyltransferase [Campylobacter corcagiensis]QOQ87383.1 tRNA (guanosine(46)-N7)-methyltransferase TrmB [Campylobacter corcagiensis]